VQPASPAGEPASLRPTSSLSSSTVSCTLNAPPGIKGAGEAGAITVGALFAQAIEDALGLPGPSVGTHLVWNDAVAACAALLPLRERATGRPDEGEPQARSPRPPSSALPKPTLRVGVLGAERRPEAAYALLPQGEKGCPRDPASDRKPDVCRR
jgi:hypothetical protein